MTLTARSYRRCGLAALVGLPLALSGCGGVPMMVLGGIASAGSIYTTVDKMTEAAAPFIAKACGEFEAAKAAADATVAAGVLGADAAAKIASVQGFGDAACARPPAGDPLSTAIWLGKLGGQLAALSARQPP